MEDSIEYAEQCLIGSVLMGGRRVLEEVNIQPDDFTNARNSIAWGLFLRMDREGTDIDLATTFSTAHGDETARRNIDGPWLHATMANTPTSGSAPHYAKIVKENSIRRSITRATVAIAQAAQDMDPADLVDFARSQIDQAADVDTGSLRPMSEHVADTIEQMKSVPNFKPTPWTSLNEVIGGFRPGALYVVGARPGAGKTIVGLQAALEMTKHGAVMFSTLEMGRDELHMRVFAQQAMVPLNRLIDSELDAEQWASIERLAPPSWDNLYIEDSATQTAESIRMAARTLSRKRQLSCIVVDYLQLMEGTAAKGVKRQELVAQWSRKLKLMAKSLQVPVIALSQLNREAAAGEPPKLSDLRESGAIEQDADVVLLMARDDKQPGDLHMQVAKNRHGARMNLRMSWFGKFSTVADPWVNSEHELRRRSMKVAS